MMKKCYHFFLVSILLQMHQEFEEDVLAMTQYYQDQRH